MVTTLIELRNVHEHRLESKLVSNHVRKNKFGLSICTFAGLNKMTNYIESVILITCSQRVNDNDDHQTHGDPNGRINDLVPERDEDGGSTQLRWQDDDQGVPVVPTNSERESGINEALC